MSKSKMTKEVVAVKEVKRIMQAEDAEATRGSTPISSINGPLRCTVGDIG